MISYKIGDQVVCLTTFRPHRVSGYSPPNHPHIGQVYTVRGFHLPLPQETAFVGFEMIGVYLEEIINPLVLLHWDKQMHEPAFNAEGFRPVKKTSIEVFKRLLKPTPKKVRQLEHALIPPKHDSQ